MKQTPFGIMAETTAEFWELFLNGAFGGKDDDKHDCGIHQKRNRKNEHVNKDV